MVDLFRQTNKEPLMEACCGGHSDVVRLLIQAGADINALSSTNTTALIYACESGHVECVKELLATGCCDLGIRNDSGHCALMEAAMVGDVEILKLLVQHGAKLTMVEGTDYKESALTLAAFKGHYDAVKYLLSLMPEAIDTPEEEEEELYASLVEASMEGHLEVGSLLLNAGAKINWAKGPFENPLTLAAGAGHTEMVKLLLSAGAEMEGPNEEGYTALMEASREGHFDVVELLLDRGADVNAKVEEGQETPLTLAASGGFKDVVELLVARGGDLTIGECTPLYEACQEGHEKVAQFIVQQLRKAYPLQAIQKDLNEALLCTAGIDCDSICKLLIENGAQIDCFSKENRTPLMEAARQNCTKVVELLIKNGADVNKIASPYVAKDVDLNMAKSKGSKKLSQKNCCPTTQCPCCVPASIKKNAKEVCTAAGIPTTPYSTGPIQGTVKKVTSSRSSTPSQNKRVPTTANANKSKFATPTANVDTANKTERSLSTSSSSATLSDPSVVCVDDLTINDAQNNDTALTLACVGGHPGLVDLLIKRGAHIEHRDKKGFTPLILAATGGHVEICKLLIDAGAQLDAQADRTKDTALSLACSGGRKDVAQLLLKHGANKEHRNLSDYTPLSLAASGGYVEIIQFLLNSGAEINSRTNSKLGISPLMLASMNGHEEAARLLLENGSDINAQIETNKNTALTLACFQGRAEVTRLLIQYGANVEHRAKTGLTPLMEAANGGYVDVGTVLIDANADVNTLPVPTSRDTALTIAADKGHAAFVGLLLRHDAQINARNKKGCTAIWLASNNGHLDTVQVLVAYNADIEAQDNRKLTPLMVAFRKGHSKLVHFLVEHVTQFPSDSDCQRFISTLADKELIEKCCQSVQYISEAKERQAEHANKAAQSLLALLAQEKAIEEAKRLSKQRQKEKKRSKKQAKKENEQQLEKTESEAIIEDDKEFDAMERKANTNEVEEKRILALLETSTRKERVLPDPSPKGNTSQNRKQNHNSVISTDDTPPNWSNKVNVSSAEPNAKNNANAEVKINKKRSSQVKVVESVKSSSFCSNTKCTTNGSSAASSTQQQQNGVSRNNSYSEEHFTELTVVPGRRPSLQVLNIAANAIARVIGRAGSNVNTIREATGAHVEVEKQSTRKEQSTRKITLKGPADAVRNAMRMIELLLKDHNMLINEIVDRVMTVQRKSPSLSSSSETSLCQPLYLQQQRVCTPPLSSVPSSPMVTNLGKMSEEAAKIHPSHSQPTASRIMGTSAMPMSPLVQFQTQSTNHSNVANSPTTNVWQKRAEAIREKKAILDGHSFHGFVSPISSQNSVNRHAIGLKNAECLPTTAVPQVKSLNAEELAILSKEEHQRKAPGYARPQSSASTTNRQLGLTNMGKTNDESSNASSLFDVLTQHWSTSPLEPAVGNGNPSDGSDLQNSWNYLLENWESNRQQRPIHPIFQNFWCQNL